MIRERFTELSQPLADQISKMVEALGTGYRFQSFGEDYQSDGEVGFWSVDTPDRLEMQDPDEQILTLIFYSSGTAQGEDHRLPEKHDDRTTGQIGWEAAVGWLVARLTEELAAREAAVSAARQQHELLQQAAEAFRYVPFPDSSVK